jgi:hypothetical protein
MRCRTGEELPEVRGVIGNGIYEARHAEHAAFFELLKWFAVQALGNRATSDNRYLKGHWAKSTREFGQTDQSWRAADSPTLGW